MTGVNNETAAQMCSPQAQAGTKVSAVQDIR